MYEETIQIQHDDERNADREREYTVREMVQEEMSESRNTSEELKELAEAMEEERQANYEREDKMGMI
jgi:hypothetical protein